MTSNVVANREPTPPFVSSTAAAASAEKSLRSTRLTLVTVCTTGTALRGAVWKAALWIALKVDMIVF